MCIDLPCLTFISQGMCFEARGEFEVAEKLYREMLIDDPASEVIGKRLVGGVLFSAPWVGIRRPVELLTGDVL